MLLNPLVLLPILWAGFAIARETTVVPGWTLNTNLLEKYGISGYTTVLEHVDPDTDTKVALESARLMLVAETAYDDLEKLAKNHKANFKKPDLVAAVQMGAKIYLASTIVRDSIHGYWSPAAGIPDVVRTALSLCQTSKYPGIANTKPQACAEAMALYLYFAENPISGSGDEVDMKDAKMVVWGKIDGNTGGQEACQAVYDNKDPSVFAKSYGCKPMVQQLGIQVIHKNVHPASSDEQSPFGELTAKPVCT